MYTWCAQAFEASCAQKFQELVASEEREGRSARSMNDGTVGLTLNAMRPVVDNLAEGNPKAVSACIFEDREREPA
jgi:hypothetical protein